MAGTKKKETLESGKNDSTVWKEISELAVRAKETKSTLDSQLKLSRRIGTEFVELKNEASNLLWKAIDQTNAQSFALRKRELNKDKIWWLFFSINMMIIWIWFSLYVLWQGVSLEFELLFRVGLITPIYAFAFLAYREYLRIDRKCEIYAFKEAIASTLQPYAELLEKKFLRDDVYSPDGTYVRMAVNQNSRERILHFLIEAMERLHAEPPISEKYSELELKARLKGIEFGMAHADGESESACTNRKKKDTDAPKKKEKASST